MKTSLFYSYHKITIILLTILLSHFSYAQKPITLREAIAGVQEKNRSILIANQQLKSAQADYNKSLGIILPQLNVSYTALTTNDPLNAFGFTLQQQQVSMASFDPNALNNPPRTNHFVTQIQLLQPLINIDGIFGRKAAKSGVNARSSMADHTENQMVLEVEKVYGQLQLMYQLVDVYKAAQKTIVEHKKIAQNFFNQGFLKKNDLLEIEIHVTDIQNQLQNAEKLVQDTSAYLNFLMGSESFTTLKPSETLALNTSKIDLTHQISTERSDLKAVAYGVDAQKNMYQATKMKFLPNINGFANYNWADDEFLKTHSNSYFMGIRMSWDVFKGMEQIGNVQKQKAELKIAELNLDTYLTHSKMELETAKRQFINAENNLQLTLLAKNHAEEALTIRKNRFDQGLEKTADLLNAETVFLQKQLAYFQAIFEYNFTISYLKFTQNQS
ncbi:MAG: TolC family protein [Flavobacteriaceae bacterium]|nr:TolC family protein [Flavobacteriaceae bacterium]